MKLNLSVDGARVKTGGLFILLLAPWRQAMEFDAGLFFISYQRAPRTGFIKPFDKMSKVDIMNQFVTHVGGGLFACPGGVAEGGFIGQRLFEKA
jgi:deferrochelatase/peroxidase EfeB